MGDLIVITINYRLNLYGFLYTGAHSIATNAGMYDQMLALQWIRQHIHHFGGDPSRVTLIGQSTGAQSVGFHILSPISSRLFNSAILISGSPLERRWLSAPDNAKQFWMSYAKDVECLGTEVSINAKVVNCLLKLNRNQLLSMTDIKRYTVDPFVVSAPVVIDQQFNSDLSLQAPISGNISVLFGYTDDEGSWGLALEDRHRFGPTVPQNMTFNETLIKLKEFVQKIKSNTDNQIDG
ncbi:unnamed protein product, partial [Oppiella nova]